MEGVRIFTTFPGLTPRVTVENQKRRLTTVKGQRRSEAQAALGSMTTLYLEGAREHMEGKEKCSWGDNLSKAGRIPISCSNETKDGQSAWDKIFK